MASFTLSSQCPSFSSSSSSSSSPLFFSAPSQLLLAHKKRNQTRFRVSCKANNPNNSTDDAAASPGSRIIDRRNVLLGLGGLYGVANLAGSPIATAADVPIRYPDVTKCHYPAHLPAHAVITGTCCPPVPTENVQDYQIPTGGPMRERLPAQSVTKDYISKYEAALSAMKKLDPSHPHSFSQQANIHCAYCNESYQQYDDPSKVIQVHNSWIFFPFHRWYLYFYEKILGKLINDPTFALPYWNWDNQRGMTMPDMFMTSSTSSSLYDANRNANYFPPAIVDLNYAGSDRGLTDEELIKDNLVAMYRSMVTNGSTSDLFLGQKYVSGDNPNPGQGSIENIPHTPVHRWVGDSVNQPNGEDMGNFYSAGRDPLFYSHHANVDRMWVIWQQQLAGKNFTDDAWLNASFLFYDENENPVRVYVKDCLDTTKMGYEYQPSALPWLNSKPAASITTGVAAASNAPFVTDVFPVTLDKVVQVKVSRPKTSRTKAEKEKEEEVLVIDGIEVAMDQYARFDVYLNDSDQPDGGKDKAQYAGGFAHLPHKKESSSTMKTSVRLGLNESLEDLGAEDDDTVLVTLAPQVGGGVVNVDSIRIEYSTR